MRRAAIAFQVLATLAVSILAIRAAGGPSSAMILQAAAGLVGALAALLLARMARPPESMVAVGLLILLLASETFVLVAGVPIEGVRRWIAFGPMQLHAASLLVPLAVWTAAQRLDVPAAIPLAATLVILAAQPDAAAVLALTLGVGAVALTDRTKRRWGGMLVGLGAVCAGWALSRPDPLPAVGHVELVVRKALEATPPIGALAVVAMVSLPGAMLWRRRVPATLALAAAWAGFVVANLVANYPAPVIGAGASPVLGWLLSIGLASVATRAKQAS